jgi:hypothetical protein
MERFAELSLYSYDIGFLLKPYRDHIKTITQTANQTHLSNCLVACKSFFEYLLSIPESNYLDFGALQWALMVQATLVLSRLTFVMASTRGWDSNTTRSNVPLVMYLDALCYRFQAVSSTPVTPITSAPRSPDVYYVFKMVLASVKKSYERRVIKILPDVISADSGGSIGMGIAKGHCPILDPSLKPYWDTDDFSSYDGSFSAGMGRTPLSEALTTTYPTGQETVMYYDVWNTMTCNWADEAIATATDTFDDLPIV